MREKEPQLYSASDGGEEKKTPSEVSPEVLRDLQDIAQRVGGDFNMKVEVGEAGKGSYFDPENVSITLDPEHIAENPERARFVALHEGAHRAITPGPLRLGLTRQEAAQQYSQLGFGYLQNVIEDGAVNTWGSRRFPGIKDDMNKVYDDQFTQENAVLSTPEVVQAADKLGYWPKFAQAGSEYLRHWHQNRYSQQLDPQVEKVLHRTGDTAQELMGTIPDPTATVRDEQAVSRQGKRRWQTTTDAIWPEFKKLVEQDKHNEALRQMVNDSDQYKQLPEEVKKQLEEAMEQHRQTQGDAEQPKDARQEDDVPAEGEKPLPLEELPEEVKKQLEEVWRNLPRQKKQEFEQQAQEELKKFEDALNKAYRGKLQRPEDLPATHAEQQARKEAEGEMAARNQAEEEDRRQLEEHLERRRRENLTPYEHIRTDMEPLIDDLHRRLRVILLPEEFGGEEAGWPSGQELDVSRAMQAEADPTQLNKLWIRDSEPGQRDYRFWHLVDVSGSMKGEPINETLKGVITASEAVDRLENRNSETMTVRQGISAFHNRYFKVKLPKQRIDSVITDKIATLSERTKDEAASTDTYQATAKALEAMRRNLGESGNYVLTFTDGEPNYDVRGKLKRLLADTKTERQKQKIQVGLIWLGGKTSEEEVQRLVKEYGYDFGLSMPAVSRSGEADFARKLGDLLEDIVRREQT